jgi:hypothetical protein
MPLARRSGAWMHVLGLILLAAACEKVSRLRAPDAGPAADARMVTRDAAPLPAPDATLPFPDAAPAPVDARPRSADARPSPVPDPRKQRLDACETDADCTTYGDPCGRGIFPVNRLHEERAHAIAQRKCPGESMGYLTTREGTATRCVRNRCRMGNELGALE